MDLAELSRSIKHEAASAQRDTTARNNPHIHHPQQTSSMSNAEDPVKAEGKGAEDANIVSIKVRGQVRRRNASLLSAPLGGHFEMPLRAGGVWTAPDGREGGREGGRPRAKGGLPPPHVLRRAARPLRRRAGRVPLSALPPLRSLLTVASLLDSCRTARRCSSRSSGRAR